MQVWKLACCISHLVCWNCCPLSVYEGVEAVRGHRYCCCATLHMCTMRSAMHSEEL